MYVMYACMYVSMDALVVNICVVCKSITNIKILREIMNDPTLFSALVEHLEGRSP